MNDFERGEKDMNAWKKSFSILFLVVGITLSACSSGSGVEEKFDKALKDIDKEWQLYEVKKQGDNTIIRIEVDKNVTFKEGEKAKAALQKIDPQLKGYIEFYNSEVGMVLRKVEIFPPTT